jgi:hypothetical protein
MELNYDETELLLSALHAFAKDKNADDRRPIEILYGRLLYHNVAERIARRMQAEFDKYGCD